MSDEVSEGKESIQLKKVPLIDSPLGTDSKADKEEKTFGSSADYEKESRESEHQRGEKLKVILHNLVVVGLIIVGILLLIGILTWSWHVLAPDNWHWLSTEQINDIHKIMSSALLALVISDYSKKYFR